MHTKKLYDFAGVKVKEEPTADHFNKRPYCIVCTEPAQLQQLARTAQGEQALKLPNGQCQAYYLDIVCRTEALNNG